MTLSFGEALLEPPFVEFNDLDSDGIVEIVVKEYAHNGTVYNAIVEHYFDIGSDMSLNRRLVLEARLLDLYTEDRNGRIMRRITKLNPHELRIDVSLVLDGNKGPQRKVGEVSQITQNGSYRVTSKRVLDPKYERPLVTGSGVSDDTFLKYGYSFRYYQR